MEFERLNKKNKIKLGKVITTAYFDHRENRVYVDEIEDYLE